MAMEHVGAFTQIWREICKFDDDGGRSFVTVEQVCKWDIPLHISGICRYIPLVRDGRAGLAGAAPLPT